MARPERRVNHLKVQHDSDHRVQQTQARLKEAMLDMMAEKPLHKITVMDLCRACQRNRATFYAHYLDIYDLAEAMEEDVLSDLEQLMAQINAPSYSSEEVSQAFFCFLHAHKQALQTFLRGENSARFTQKIDQKIMPYFELKVRQKYEVPLTCPPHTLPLLLRFIATGYYSFFTQALRTEDISITQLAQFASRLGDACLSEFLKGPT